MSALLIATQECEAWLVGLDHAFAPEGVSLCERHADRIRVPVGWGLHDERPAPTPVRRRRKKRAPAPDLDLDGAAAAPRPEPVATTATSVEPATAVEGDGGDEDAQTREPESGREDTAGPEGASPEPSVEATIAERAGETDPPGDPVVEAATPGGVPSDGHNPADTPMHADAVAAAITDDDPRHLQVVPTVASGEAAQVFEESGQGALWAPESHDELHASDSTPLLKRAFRVVRDD